jgi:hypothetical protein
MIAVVGARLRLFTASSMDGAAGQRNGGTAIVVPKQVYAIINCSIV